MTMNKDVFSQLFVILVTNLYYSFHHYYRRALAGVSLPKKEISDFAKLLSFLHIFHLVDEELTISLHQAAFENKMCCCGLP